MRFQRLSPAGTIALAVLIAATLACGPTGIVSTPTPPPTLTPTPLPTATPTLPPPVTGGGKPTSAPPPVQSAALSPENVAGLMELSSGQVDEVVLLAADASPASYEVATFGGDAIVRIWDLNTGDLIYEMPGHTSAGFALKYSPDGRLLASGGGDFRVRIWDTSSGQLLNTIIVNSNPYRIIWSVTGDGIGVVGEGSSRVELFEPLSGVKIGDLRPPDNRVLWSAAVSPDNLTIAVADNIGRVTLFDSQTLTFIGQDTSTASGAGWDLEFSPDGSLLASCNDGGGVYIWKAGTFSPVLGGVVHDGDCVDGVFSSDSRLYFSAGDDGVIYAWDVVSGEALAEVHLGMRIWTISLTNDGQYLVAAMDDGTLRILGLP